MSVGPREGHSLLAHHFELDIVEIMLRGGFCEGRIWRMVNIARPLAQNYF